MMDKAPKKRGRPATGLDPTVKVRVPKPVIDQIDRWAAGFHHMNHSAALRCLIYLGLNQLRPQTVYDPKGFAAYHNKRNSAAPMPPSTLAERLHLSLLREHGANVKIGKSDGGKNMSEAIEQLLAQLNDAPIDPSKIL